VDLVGVGEQMKARKKELEAEIDEDNLPTPVTTTMTGAILEHARASNA